MSLSVSRTRLHGAMKQLRVHWDLARSKWDDPMSREFEKRHLRLLEPKIKTTVTAMEKMQAVLAKARRDCG